MLILPISAGLVTNIKEKQYNVIENIDKDNFL